MESKANRKLTVMFAVLCAICFAYLVIGFLSIPGYYQRVTTLTIQVYDMPGANYPTNAGVSKSAAIQGLTLAQYAVVQIAFHCVIVLLNILVASLILLRARWNWYAWYSAFFLIFMAGFGFYDETYVAHLLPLWVSTSGALFWPLILPYLYLFPNGKAAPRKSLWVIGPFIILHLFVQASGFLSIFPEFPALASFMENVVRPAQVLVFPVFLVIIASQVYRYRRISTRAERQQSKWFLMGLVFSIGLSTLSESLGDRNPYRAEVGLLIFLFVPMSVGVAILRYRLWEIDLIIRRTLQYGLLSGMLALAYFGSVLLGQNLAGALTGSEQSPWVLVVSTLLIAGLFNPLRIRVQDFIDWRFYRRKYDAQMALGNFSVVARDETDLASLTDELVMLVAETLQPASVNLWLPPAKYAKLSESNRKQG